MLHSMPMICHMHEPGIAFTPPSATIVSLTRFLAHVGDRSRSLPHRERATDPRPVGLSVRWILG
jgi:hypothetical protein